jgi:hypothetical protein
VWSLLHSHRHECRGCGATRGTHAHQGAKVLCSSSAASADRSRHSCARAESDAHPTELNNRSGIRPHGSLHCPHICYVCSAWNNCAAPHTCLQLYMYREVLRACLHNSRVRAQGSRQPWTPARRYISSRHLYGARAVPRAKHRRSSTTHPPCAAPGRQATGDNSAHPFLTVAHRRTKRAQNSRPPLVTTSTVLPRDQPTQTAHKCSTPGKQPKHTVAACHMCWGAVCLNSRMTVCNRAQHGGKHPTPTQPKATNIPARIRSSLAWCSSCVYRALLLLPLLTAQYRKGRMLPPAPAHCTKPPADPRGLYTPGTQCAGTAGSTSPRAPLRKPYTVARHVSAKVPELYREVTRSRPPAACANT